MAKKHNIRCYDYVNHPYEQVREALFEDFHHVFSAATHSAEARAQTVAAGLHVNVAGFEIGKEVNIKITGRDDFEGQNLNKACLSLEWQAAASTRLFPVMTAELFIYPITSTETQLDFCGTYDPPLGILGKAIDSVVGHRIAEASVHHFVSEVAGYLRKNLAQKV